MSFLDNAIGSLGSNVKNAFQGIANAIGGALTLDLGKVAQGVRQAMGGADSSSTGDAASNAASSMADDGLEELLKMMRDQQPHGGGDPTARLAGLSGMRA